MTINDALNTAVAHHRAGRLAEAERIYRDILRQHPNHPVALYFLGRVAAATGHFDHAATLLSRASKIDPTNADCLGILGEVYEQLGRTDDAIAAYRAAVALRPDWVEVLNNLGHLLQTTGRTREAIDAYQSAIRHRPDMAETHSNLAEAFRSESRLPEALEAARRAVELKPDFPAAHGNLGNALHGLARYEEALDCFREAIRLDGQFIDAWSNLALALAALHRYDEALAAFAEALKISPNPAAAQIQTNLGATYLSMGRVDDAVDAYRAAIALQDNLPNTHSNLGSALRVQGEIDQAIAAFRTAAALEPRFALAHSNLLFTLHFQPDVTNAQLLAEHRAWAARHADPLTRAAAPHANIRDPERRLRVGFVSPDLRDHPIGRFMLPLLAHHDAAKMEVICYSAAARPDAITSRLREHAAQWRDVIGLSSAALAEMIRRDGVDVLIDLSLHSAANALMAFALKPAPVQVTWLGYAGTSGMMAMDFRITDPYLDPPCAATVEKYSERSLHLPRTYWCYAAPPEAPADVAPPPSQSSGYVTFGCLNQFSKVSPPALQTWLRILEKTPNSRLILHSLPGRHGQRVAGEFSAAGVDPARLEWVDKLAMADYLATWNRIDIALDPFPYNGGTTTCDALWMGVPVVTLAGDRAVARAGASILSNAGLEELVARDVDDYVRIATELARKPMRISRERLLGSPLMDATSFARDFEEVIRTAWRRWCENAL